MAERWGFDLSRRRCAELRGGFLMTHLCIRGEAIFFQTENDAENLWNAGGIGSMKPASAGFFA
jgi:hypothetical protein